MPRASYGLKENSVLTLESARLLTNFLKLQRSIEKKKHVAGTARVSPGTFYITQLIFFLSDINNNVIYHPYIVELLR